MNKNLVVKTFDKLQENRKKFIIAIDIDNHYIGDLHGGIELCFVDNLEMKTLAFPSKYHPVVGYIKGNTDFVLLGVRREEEMFSIDIFNLAGGEIYQLLIIDDIVEVEYVSKILEVGESEYGDEIYLAKVKKKSANDGEDGKATDIYKNILNLKDINIKQLRPIDLYLSSTTYLQGEHEYYQYLVSQLVSHTLLLLKIIISNYLAKNNYIPIEDLVGDEKFVKRFKKISRTRDRIIELLNHYDLDFIMGLYLSINYYSKKNYIFEEAPDNLVDYLE